MVGMFLLLVLTRLALAGPVPMPRLPVGETAGQIETNEVLCGELVLYAYERWDIWTINGKWALIADKEEMKFWFIPKLDGKIDKNNYFENIRAFTAKYPVLGIGGGICDILQTK